MKEKLKTLILGLALGLAVSANWQLLLALTAAVMAMGVVDYLTPRPPIKVSLGPKIIHLFVPGETHDLVRQEAEKGRMTLAEFAALGLTLAVTLSQTIRKKGSIVVRAPGEQEQIIDAF